VAATHTHPSSPWPLCHVRSACRLCSHLAHRSVTVGGSSGTTSLPGSLLTCSPPSPMRCVHVRVCACVRACVCVSWVRVRTQCSCAARQRACSSVSCPHQLYNLSSSSPHPLTQEGISPKQSVSLGALMRGYIGSSCPHAHTHTHTKARINTHSHCTDLDHPTPQAIVFISTSELTQVQTDAIQLLRLPRL